MTDTEAQFEQRMVPMRDYRRLQWFLGVLLGFSILTNVGFIVDDYYENHCESEVLYRGNCVPVQQVDVDGSRRANT